jgi:hypothetical protein
MTAATSDPSSRAWPVVPGGGPGSVSGAGAGSPPSGWVSVQVLGHLRRARWTA